MKQQSISSTISAGQLLGFCVAFAIAQLAQADEIAALSPAALAAAEATLDLCAQANPKSADQYWQKAKLLLQGVPAKTAAEMRDSAEYRQAYESATQMLAKVAKADALRACTDSPEAKQ